MSSDKDYEVYSELGNLSYHFIYNKETLDYIIEKNDVDILEIVFVANFVHSFYTGVEKLLITILNRFGELSEYKNVGSWHKLTLDISVKPTLERDSIISTETYSKLKPIREFRHKFRNMYIREIEWKNMKNGFISLQRVWVLFFSDISSFMISASGRNKITDDIDRI